MYITESKLRKIIRETLIMESIPMSRGDLESHAQPTFGKGDVELPHPLLKGNYAGNGYVLSVFRPGRDWLTANRDKSEHFSLVLDIMDRKIRGLYYVPFIFANEVMQEMEKHGAPKDVISSVRAKTFGTDSEYAAPDW